MDIKKRGRKLRRSESRAQIDLRASYFPPFFFFKVTQNQAEWRKCVNDTVDLM